MLHKESVRGTIARDVGIHLEIWNKMFVQADLKAIENAIASGTLRVRLADREVWYQTTADLLKAREAVRRELGRSCSKRITAIYDKGLTTEPS